MTNWWYGEGPAKYYIFLDNFCLKQPLVLKIPLGMFFVQETQKWHQNGPKPTDIEL